MVMIIFQPDSINLWIAFLNISKSKKLLYFSADSIKQYLLLSDSYNEIKPSKPQLPN